MYRQLLVPLDGSPLSEHALPIACHIARRAGATLRLVHVHVPYDTIYVEGMPVIDARLHSLGREHERAYLERIRDRLAQGADVPIDCVHLDGAEPVASTLARYVAESGSDLVVMTTHGRGGLARFWLGSVADALVRLSPVPILLLRPAADILDSDRSPEFDQILIPLDGSAMAEQILTPALALGRLMQASYILLRVVEPILLHQPGPFVAPVGLDADQTAQLQAAAHTYLDTVARRLQAADVQVHTRVLVAPQPARAILDTALQHQKACIAMATHGKVGLTRLLLGSVADKVMRGAEVPVLLYRPGVNSTGQEIEP